MESLDEIIRTHTKDELNLIIKTIKNNIRDREKLFLDFKKRISDSGLSNEMIEHQCLVKMAILGLVTREYATQHMIDLEKIILEKDPSQKVNFPYRS
jgi:hypothetical protein